MIVILLGLLCRLNAGGESAHVPVLELDKLLHQEASDQQRREQGHDNAQQQRLGEALHRAGAEDHQHDGGDNGGHVRVDDGAQRVVEAGLEGNLQAAARADFLIEALEDNDIGVHRHADAQHDTGNARQGQLNAGENRQHPEQHDCVNAQRPGGDHAVQAVADNHDEHDQRDADDGSENGGGQRIIAQRGGHGINLLLRQHQRQRAGLNLRGDGLRTIHREVAGNLTGAAGDGGLHGGRHQLLAVQIDAQRLADVLACHVGKELRARGGQLEGNRPLTVLRHGGLRQTDVRAGHEGVAVRILELFKNMTEQNITDSVDAFEKAIRESQILMFAGGFSAGDEPDGSAKFITSIFRNEKIKDAVHELLDERDGLVLGICNGFQALIKLGLVPYGKITTQLSDSPTLTTNSIGRHVSKTVYTKVVTNKSPWLQEAELGGVYSIPASHGEGRFVASDEWIQKLFANGQVATQYVDIDGNPTMDEDFNPNGSYCAIEGITSPDGRVLGKMAHSERRGDGVAVNIYGDQDQKIFKSGVKYFA